MSEAKAAAKEKKKRIQTNQIQAKRYSAKNEAADISANQVNNVLKSGCIYDYTFSDGCCVYLRCENVEDNCDNDDDDADRRKRIKIKTKFH